MRVHYVNSARKSKKPRTCRCGHTVEPGEPYKWAEPRFGPIKVWCKDHSPKRSELTSSKLGVVYDAQDEFDVSETKSAEEISDALNAIAETARGVGEEYQESIDAMPEGLQEGHVAEEMTEKIEALESYADSLESWDPSEHDEVVSCEVCEGDVKDLTCTECGHEHEDDPLEAARAEAQDLVNGLEC